MDYAATRFAENGYHPTSVAEIVQGLGVGKGVFYWYFDSKEELFLEILREAQHRPAPAPAAGDRRRATTRSGASSWASGRRCVVGGAPRRQPALPVRRHRGAVRSGDAQGPGHRRRRRHAPRQGRHRRGRSATPTRRCSPTPSSASPAISPASSSTSARSPRTRSPTPPGRSCLEGLLVPDAITDDSIKLNAGDRARHTACAFAAMRRSTRDKSKIGEAPAVARVAGSVAWGASAGSAERPSAVAPVLVVLLVVVAIPCSAVGLGGALLCK